MGSIRGEAPSQTQRKFTWREMMGVSVCRAETRDQRLTVLTLIEKCFEREGQQTGPNYFKRQADGAAPAADTSAGGADESLPWRDKAELDGGPYTYYTVDDESELEPIAAVVMDERSDAVWSLELFAAERRRGAAAMGALLKHAFIGRDEFRVLCLEAADGARMEQP